MCHLLVINTLCRNAGADHSSNKQSIHPEQMNSNPNQTDTNGKEGCEAVSLLSKTESQGKQNEVSPSNRLNLIYLIVDQQLPIIILPIISYPYVYIRNPSVNKERN